MAIDSAEKRFSMMGFGVPFIKKVVPQGSLGATGRATMLDIYNGISLDVPVTASRIMRQWNHKSNKVKTLQIKTQVKSLDIKAGLQ